MTYVYPPATTTTGTGAGYTLDWQPPTTTSLTIGSLRVDEVKKLRGPRHEDVRDGVMLALFPDPAAAAELALPNGTPASELHVTVAYLGKAGDVDEGALTELARAVAGETGRIGGQISGHARFTGGEDGDVLVALFDSPALEDLRRRVCDALIEAGIQWPRNHGYTPHMTLAYLDAGDASPFGRLPATPLTFTALSVVHGTGRSDLALSGQPPAATPAPQVLATKKHAAVVDVGHFVAVDDRLGRVELIVTGGQLPGIAGSEAVVGTKDNPAARIVEYAPAGDGTFAPTGNRYARTLAELAPAPALRTRQAKSLAEAISWTQVAYLHTDVPIPPKETLMAVYDRGVKSWPGPQVTSLTAQQWGLGRVDAFAATWHGMRPAGYRADDDLLTTPED